MTHLTEEELLDLYYQGAAAPAPAVYDTHLPNCPRCRQALLDLQLTLDAFHNLPIPEPPPFTWRPPLRARLAHWRPWLLTPALASALLAAFFFGRATMPVPHTPSAIPQLADSSRQRILLVALGDHLQRSQMVLLEVANGDGAALPATQQRARNLIGENRLYRQTILYSGSRAYASLLDELDRLLTGIANGQSQSSTPHADRIEQLLFKIRVTDANLEKGTDKL